MKRRKFMGIESKKARYGLIFLSPWIIGMALFFLFPIFQSMYFSFANLKVSEFGVEAEFVKFKNYHNILYINPDYVNNLIESLSSFFVSLPFILVISLILSLFLNSNFRGRLFFRALFFVPVIFASGPALKTFLVAASGNATEVAISDSVAFNMFDFNEMLKGLGLPESIEKYLMEALNNLFMLVWQSGIQIVLFIAGLQSIPELMYEVSKVEGATKWEEFWFVTLPMLLRPTLLVIIFTMVENIVSETNPVIAQSYNQFNVLEFGLGSAMLWLYFVITGSIIGLVLLLYNKVLLKRWD